MLRAHLTRTEAGIPAGRREPASCSAPSSDSREAARQRQPQSRHRRLCRRSPGVAEVGDAHWSATRGTWTGSPTSFHFAMAAAATRPELPALAIRGRPAKIYTVDDRRQGHTLRVRVTAQNSCGSTTATSAAPSARARERMSGRDRGVIPSARRHAAGAARDRRGVGHAGCDAVDAVAPASPSRSPRAVLAPCGARASSAAAVPYNQFAVAAGARPARPAPSR